MANQDLQRLRAGGRLIHSSRCSLCGSTTAQELSAATDYLTGARFSVGGCVACGLVQTLPRPTAEALHHYYPPTYYGRRKSLVDGMIDRSRARVVLRWRRRGRVLDIGCGNGGFLHILERRGWEAAGIELSESAAQAAMKRLRGEVYTRSLEACQFAASSFDVITLWHVLEHLPSPIDTLREAFRLLRPNGLLFIQAPNFASIQSRIAKGSWFHLDVPRHLWHFSPATLKGLLGTAGFCLLRLTTLSLVYDTFGIIQSSLNRVCTRQNLLFQFLTSTYPPSDGSRGSRVIADPVISLLSLPVLTPPALLISLISPIFALGGTLDVVAGRGISDLGGGGDR